MPANNRLTGPITSSFFLRLNEDLGYKRSLILPLFKILGAIKMEEGTNKGAYFFKGCTVFESPVEDTGRDGVYIILTDSDMSPCFLAYSAIEQIRLETDGTVVVLSETACQ